MLSVVFKFFKGCCGITACSYRLTVAHNVCKGLTLNPVISHKFYSLHGFVENHFFTATVLDVCLFLLICIWIPYSHFSMLFLLITHLYTDFFSLFGRVYQVPSLSKSLCSALLFLILSLQISQTFQSHKFFTLYQT